MINATEIITAIEPLVIEGDILKELSNIFLPSIIFYWILQFILTLILGLAIVKRDRSTFYAIFILSQLVGGIVLFFIFVLPIIPQFISEVFM